MSIELKKSTGFDPCSLSFPKGQPIFLLTRAGEILEGYVVQSIFMDQVLLNEAPFEGSPKQGYDIRHGVLKPNWCDGRKYLIGGYRTLEEAQARQHKIGGAR